MTSAEKLALMKRSYAAFTDGLDIEALIQLCHPDCEWRNGPPRTARAPSPPSTSSSSPAGRKRGVPRRLRVRYCAVMRWWHCYRSRPWATVGPDNRGHLVAKLPSRMNESQPEGRRIWMRATASLPALAVTFLAASCGASSQTASTRSTGVARTAATAPVTTPSTAASSTVSTAAAGTQVKTGVTKTPSFASLNACRLLPQARAEKLEPNLTSDASNANTPQGCAYHSVTGQVLFLFISENQAKAQGASIARRFATESSRPFLRTGGLGGPVGQLGTKAFAGSIAAGSQSIASGTTWIHGEYLLSISTIHRASSLSESTAATTSVAREIDASLP